MRKMIDMACEAGMTGLEDGGLFDNFLVFETLVRADEREACLSVIKPNATPMEIAAAIRARENT